MAAYVQRCPCVVAYVIEGRSPIASCLSCGGTGLIHGNGSAGGSSGQLRDRNVWDGKHFERIRDTVGAAS